MQAFLIEHGHWHTLADGTRTNKWVAPMPYMKPALDKNIKFAQMVLREKMDTGR
jgi:hypothetical protein